MRLNLRKHTSSKAVARAKKKIRVRKKVRGSAERPRLCVFRSGKHIYAQIVDDDSGTTLAAASSLKAAKGQKGKEVAKIVGGAVAKIAKEKKIESVVFDRSGYIYHGRVEALAQGAREAGLNF